MYHVKTLSMPHPPCRLCMFFIFLLLTFGPTGGLSVTDDPPNRVLASRAERCAKCVARILPSMPGMARSGRLVLRLAWKPPESTTHFTRCQTRTRSEQEFLSELWNDFGDGQDRTGSRRLKREMTTADGGWELGVTQHKFRTWRSAVRNRPFPDPAVSTPTVFPHAPIFSASCTTFTNSSPSEQV